MGNIEKDTSKTYVEKAVASKSNKAIRSFLDVLIITVIVMLVIAEIVLNIYKGIERHKISKKEQEIQEMIADSEWLKERSSEWDVLFNKGEYEQLVENFDEATKENKVTSDYKYESFIYQYRRFLAAEASIEAYAQEGSSHSERVTTNFLYDTISFVHGYDFLRHDASEKEKEVIAKCKLNVFEKASAALEMTDKEYEKFMKQFGAKGETIRYTKCSEVAKEMVGTK